MYFFYNKFIHIRVYLFIDITIRLSFVLPYYFGNIIDLYKQIYSICLSYSNPDFKRRYHFVFKNQYALILRQVHSAINMIADYKIIVLRPLFIEAISNKYVEYKAINILKVLWSDFNCIYKTPR